MKNIIVGVKQAVRTGMRGVARALNRVSHGRLTPNSITWFGLGMHLPITWAIATNRLVLAGLLLIIFGLFDTLDGELARLQGRVSNLGGFLDATTDRLKEVLIYSGAAYALAVGKDPRWALLPTAAVGVSICVSYVKAKGEAIIAAQKTAIPYPELNRMFDGGLFPFEVRMLVIVLGLLSHQLVWAIGLTALFSLVTVIQRMYIIGRKLQ